MSQYIADRRGSGGAARSRPQTWHAYHFRRFDEDTMTEPGSAPRFAEQALLRNGTPVLIRALVPQDRDKIVAAFAKLDPASVYTRFFSFKKELSDADLKRLDAADPARSLALAAFVGGEAEETLIGAASYVALPPTENTRAVEVAFTIEEDYQGQGLATRLFAALAAVARQHGFTHLEAEVLAGNAPMLAVFERSGLPLAKRKEGGVVHVVMPLGGTGQQR
jgi:RimJ/RimL family protein N-acetyltransferase